MLQSRIVCRDNFTMHFRNLIAIALAGSLWTAGGVRADEALQEKVKAMIKDDHLGKDDEKRAEDEIQKITDEFIADVDVVLKEKEEDLLSV